MAKLIAALAAAAIMIVIIFAMVNFFLRLIGGGLISSLSDSQLPLETMPVTDALPWDNSDAAFDNAGEIASDSPDDYDNDVFHDEDEEGDVEEVPLYDPDTVFPEDEDDDEDFEETGDEDDAGWEEDHPGGED